MRFESVNPATGELLAVREEMTGAEIEDALASADAAFAKWRRQPLEARAACARRLGVELAGAREELARLMALEMGKPISQARAEVDKCAASCGVLAELAAEALADRPVATDASRSCVAHEPLGVVLGIMPWNFPAWQVVRLAVPALLAGNTVLLKHAPSTMGCALLLERLVRQAGFPPGCFRALLVDHGACARLVADARVRGVSLTGSTRAGRAVGELAGRHLKPAVLELGGSDPCLVLEDADLDLAVAACVASRFQNAGQSCIAAKRWIVVESIVEEFSRRAAEAVGRLVVGDPLREDVEVGPLARRDLRDQLQAQVLATLRAGASRLAGGDVPEGPGCFHPPTLLAGVRPGMPAADEELFGPVACLLSARDEEQALDLAAATPFGLGASLFTRDSARGERLARTRLAAGSCFVNGMVRSDPRLPFGGIRDSGFGRELGVEGFRAFVNAKTIWVR